MDDLTSVIGASLISILAAGSAYFAARRLGLSAVQREVKTEGERLVSTLRQRLDLVEKENARLKQRQAELEAENETLQRRIDALERALADRAIEGRR